MYRFKSHRMAPDQGLHEISYAARRCWIEEAHVTDLTPLLRSGRAGNQLAGWPATMRIFAPSPLTSAEAIPATKKGTLGLVEPPAHRPASRAPVIPGA